MTANKFVLPRVFSLIETICPKTWSTSRISNFTLEELMWGVILHEMLECLEHVACITAELSSSSETRYVQCCFNVVICVPT